MEVCRVGYALNAKKLRRAASVTDEDKTKEKDSKNTLKSSQTWRGGGLADILELEPDSTSPDELVQFIPYDFDSPVHEMPHFHVIIHKLTEDIDNPSSLSKITSLETYLHNHPTTIMVDPISSVKKVINRHETCRYLANIREKLASACPFDQPAFILIREEDSDEAIASQIDKLQIRFPVICKPLEACGTPNSHRMVSKPTSSCSV
ncbi:hypothetical protein EON65_54850 [archaeon]|nr:MAG: hypothetical protein EON65_54850 [archaeon]